MTSTDMIDQTRIDELRTEIGDEDLHLIITVYVEEARATLEQISGGLSQEEHRRAVHFLRSGALNLGLRGMSTVAGELEADLMADPAAAQASSAARLADILDRTQAELGMLSH